jgi:hypothetical protein
VCVCVGLLNARSRRQTLLSGPWRSGLLRSQVPVPAERAREPKPKIRDKPRFAVPPGMWVRVRVSVLVGNYITSSGCCRGAPAPGAPATTAISGGTAKRETTCTLLHPEDARIRPASCPMPMPYAPRSARLDEISLAPAGHMGVFLAHLALLVAPETLYSQPLRPFFLIKVPLRATGHGWALARPGGVRPNPHALRTPPPPLAPPLAPGGAVRSYSVAALCEAVQVQGRRPRCVLFGCRAVRCALIRLPRCVFRLLRGRSRQPTGNGPAAGSRQPMGKIGSSRQPAAGSRQPMGPVEAPPPSARAHRHN